MTFEEEYNHGKFNNDEEDENIIMENSIMMKRMKINEII